MRIKPIAFSLIWLVVASCSKNMSSPTPIDVSGLPVSYFVYSPQAGGQRTTDAFEYGSNRNLASIHFASTDSLNGMTYLDSGSYFFSVDPGVDLPTGYLYDHRTTYDSAALVEAHLLYFNSHNQLLKDSCVVVLSGSNPYPHTSYYVYSGNLIVVSSYDASYAQKWNKFETDSLIMDRSNLVHAASYTFSAWGSISTAYSMSEFTQNNFTTDVNPFYDPGLADALGSFLYIAHIGDFLSKYLPQEGMEWIKNANGKVYSGISPNGYNIGYGY